MRMLLTCLALVLAAPAPALELELRDFYDLNRPASLEFDPTFCGLWIANEGPEVILVTLDGLELRRFGSDLFRIKAIALEGDVLILGDGLGRFQRVTKDGTPLAAPFTMETGIYRDSEGIVADGDGRLIIVED